MLKKLIFLIGVCFSCAFALQDPVVFMQEVTNDVLIDLNKLANNDKNDALYEIINKKILLHVDIEFMARWVVGRKAWNDATKKQQEDFIQVFTKLLSRTYSSTLLVFKDRQIKYYRTGSSDYKTASRIQIICEIQQSGDKQSINKDPIKGIYQMHLVKENWMIFDVLVEGVSMLKGLQAQYEQVIAREGIDGATVLIQKKLTGE
ncbi:ABC transporter substrate-binding protein [bacterium]|nr:ABC transporter substrate-binding protein [bacterium]NBX72582.1 ABC transporter substrate-binding protein [bacterium]